MKIRSYWIPVFNVLEKKVYLEFYTRQKFFSKWENDKEKRFSGKQEVSFSLDEITKRKLQSIYTSQKWHILGE